ncbi:MAG: ECF transporter S component [archaeon GB-1867-005]|nr:ECF transporter S component [Candidatus Culexmicrobium cathedralense]
MVFKLLTARSISITALMSALVCVATLVFQVYIPETHGYFNVGEVAVYTSALIFGPIVGGLAGGIGSALADLLSGYGYYAPGTLIIKGLEGFIVGFLSLTFKRFHSKTWLRLISLLAAVASSATIYYVGSTLYSGLMELSIGLPPYIEYTTIYIEIPSAFWILPSLLLLILLTYFELKVGRGSALSMLSTLIGGLEMVLGYFIYECYVMSFGLAALAEVPFNICQMLIGAIVSAFIVHGVSRAIGSKL